MRPDQVFCSIINCCNKVRLTKILFKDAFTPAPCEVFICTFLHVYCATAQDSLFTCMGCPTCAKCAKVTHGLFLAVSLTHFCNVHIGAFFQATTTCVWDVIRNQWHHECDMHFGTFFTWCDCGPNKGWGLTVIMKDFHKYSINIISPNFITAHTHLSKPSSGKTSAVYL